MADKPGNIRGARAKERGLGLLRSSGKWNAMAVLLFMVPAEYRLVFGKNMMFWLREHTLLFTIPILQDIHQGCLAVTKCDMLRSDGVDRGDEGRFLP